MAEEALGKRLASSPTWNPRDVRFGYHVWTAPGAIMCPACLCGWWGRWP